jgi:16S rRNA (guanine966-N2)-methyltransferase
LSVLPAGQKPGTTDVRRGATITGVRVVAGIAGGRRLQAPPGHDVRPTSDRVREAVFSSLESMGGVRDASVLDLFAGSGALGIEALSRGAVSAIFVDNDKAAVAAVEANLASTGLAGGTVVRADVRRWLDGNAAVDLALVDPPYSFNGWEALFSRINAELIVAESDRELERPEGWAYLKVKRYGGTVVHLAAPD